jgi:signal transduction histidine kinase
VAAAVAECKRLVDNIFRTVRDLALGLRPSMLDDFGLQPALEWHVRDFTSRSGLNVELTTEGTFDDLPDRYRICVYRAVQEALTNCARHSRAQSIRIRVSADVEQLSVLVADDGVGLDPNRRRTGLGLRGIEERVKELRGVMTIRGDAGRGTTIAIRLPMPARAETPLARAAS